MVLRKNLHKVIQILYYRCRPVGVVFSGLGSFVREFSAFFLEIMMKKLFSLNEIRRKALNCGGIVGLCLLSVLIVGSQSGYASGSSNNASNSNEVVLIAWGPGDSAGGNANNQNVAHGDNVGVQQGGPLDMAPPPGWEYDVGGGGNDIGDGDLNNSQDGEVIQNAGQGVQRIIDDYAIQRMQSQIAAVVNRLNRNQWLQ
jgi:hypothetical protein